MKRDLLFLTERLTHAGRAQTRCPHPAARHWQTERYGGSGKTAEVAQVYKVDVGEITEQVKQEFAAKEKAKNEKTAAPNSAAKPQQKTAKKSAAA